MKTESAVFRLAAFIVIFFTKIGHCLHSINLPKPPAVLNQFRHGQPQFMGSRYYNLHHKPFLSPNYTTTEGGIGHPGFMFYKYPAVEKHMRA